MNFEEPVVIGYLEPLEDPTSDDPGLSYLGGDCVG
jgi:hypothetical protein